jgi:superfamily II DNA or RNA helicase
MGLHDELITHIKFTTYRSLINQDSNLYQIVYLDECHNILENHSKFLALYQGKILGLTGTPPANEHSSKFKMMNKYFPIVYRFSIDEASDKDIINDYQIIIHELSLSKDRNLKKNKKDGGHWYTSEFSDYQWLCEKIEEAGNFKQKQLSAVMRMKGLMNYPTKEKYTKTLLKNISAKCIVFANTTDQADQMCPHSYHSKNPLSEQNLQLFTDGRINQLSCVLQLSEGATIPNLKAGIIMHSYGNEHKASQRIGRLLRLNPTDKATCHILCYKNTMDATWIQDALKDFDQSKITYFNPLME